MLFIRFIFCLGVGLVGLCMVLLTIMETLFADWDVAHDLKVAWRRNRHFMRHMLDRRPDEDALHHRRMNAYGRPAAPQRQIEYNATSLPAPVPEPAHEPEAEPREPAAV